MTLPTPIKSDGRTCFGIEYFSTAAEAKTYAKHIRKRGDQINGGWFDGAPCGRAVEFDYVDEETGKHLYAVTTK